MVNRLEDLRIEPDQVRNQAQPKRWRRHFVRVPWTWVERLREARRISTYRLALVLIYESWRLGGRTIALSNVFVRAEGVPARSEWRALAELERLGLIQVNRQRRHAPQVILRDLARDPP
jgi:hypothetical protein